MIVGGLEKKQVIKDASVVHIYLGLQTVDFFQKEIMHLVEFLKDLS